MFRCLTLIMLLSDVVGAVEPACSTTSAESASLNTIVDHRALHSESAVTADMVTQAAAQRAVLLTAAAVHPLIDGIRRLPERYSGFRATTSPSRVWYRREGGTGTFRGGGRADPSERAQAFARMLVDRRYGDTVDVAAMALGRRDVSHGRRIETTTVYRRTARMDVRYHHTGLSDVFVERINTFANIQGVTTPVSYPLELPNIETTGVGTSVAAPAGYGSLPRSQPIFETRTVAHARHPVMAYGHYTGALDAMAESHPAVTPLLLTVPLAADGNHQRFAFNQAIRAEAVHRRAVLLDVAAIMSHDRNGERADQYGVPVVSADWYAGDEFSDELADRLADGWIIALAKASSAQEE